MAGWCGPFRIGLISKTLDYYLCVLFWAGSEPYQRVQWTETHKAGKQKYTPEYNKHQSQCAWNCSSEIKRCKDNSQDYPDDPVCITQILFHSCCLLVDDHIPMQTAP